MPTKKHLLNTLALVLALGLASLSGWIIYTVVLSSTSVLQGAGMIAVFLFMLTAVMSLTWAVLTLLRRRVRAQSNPAS